jgi:hypothetical protein
MLYDRLREVGEGAHATLKALCSTAGGKLLVGVLEQGLLASCGAHCGALEEVATHLLPRTGKGARVWLKPSRLATPQATLTPLQRLCAA